MAQGIAAANRAISAFAVSSERGHRMGVDDAVSSTRILASLHVIILIETVHY